MKSGLGIGWQNLIPVLKLSRESWLILDQDSNVLFESIPGLARRLETSAPLGELLIEDGVRLIHFPGIHEAEFSSPHFFSNLSHELRTPLNAIHGMASLSLELAQDPELREYLEILSQSVDNLTGLINTMLDFSRLRTGSLDLEPEVVESEAYFIDILRPLGYRAESSGLEMPVSISPRVPAELWLDKARVKVILDNLVSNALKFTTEGYLSVRIDFDQDVLRMEVEDTGMGIDQTEVDRIIYPFQQVDPGPTRRFGGTGIGLTVSKLLAQAMEGRLELDSELGRGTLARVFLPIDRRAQASSGKGSAVGSRPSSGPLLEDWPFPYSSVFYLSPLRHGHLAFSPGFQILGIEFSHASSWEAAVSLDPETCLVLLSCLHADFVQLSSRIRDMGFALLPVVEQGSARALGAKLMARMKLPELRLPSGPRTLLAAIAELGKGARDTSYDASALAGLEVLVLAGKDAQLPKLSMALSGLGTQATPAASIEESLSKIRSGRIGAVLVDSSSGGTGLELARLIRAGELSLDPSTPILFLAESGQKKDHDGWGEVHETKIQAGKTRNSEGAIEEDPRFDAVLLREGSSRQLMGEIVDKLCSLFMAPLPPKRKASQMSHESRVSSLRELMAQGAWWEMENFVKEWEAEEEWLVQNAGLIMLKLKIATRKEDVQGVDQALQDLELRL